MVKVQKKRLLEILERLNSGLSTDEIIEGSDSICFDGDMVYTFNDRVWVLFPLEIGFCGKVKADKFYRHLKKAVPDKEGDIGFDNEGSELVITSGKKGKTKAGLPLTPASDDHGFYIHGLSWKKLPVDFGQAIKQAYYYASTNFNKPKLTCIHINGKIVEASDGQRAYRHTLSKKIKSPFLIPAHVVGSLRSDDYTEYALDFESNWVFFKSDEGAITALRIPAERDYVDTDFLFEMGNGKNIEFPKDITPTIDKAVDFIGQEEQYSYLLLKFQKENKRIIVETSSDHGWFRSPIKWKSKINLSFFINPFFLKDILKSTFTAKIDKKMGLLLFESDNWQVIINITLD